MHKESEPNKCLHSDKIKRRSYVTPLYFAGEASRSAGRRKEAFLYQQILEWLTNFVSILGKGSVLRDAARRKRLGKYLLELHQALLRLAETASAIERHLSRIREANSPVPSGVLKALKDALTCQRLELLRLNALLRENREFLEIYGDGAWNEIAQLITIKDTVIGVLCAILRGRHDNTLVLPKSFDLMVLQPFAKMGWQGGLSDLQYYGEEYVPHHFGQHWSAEFLADEKDWPALLEHAGHLLDEIVRFRSASRAEKAKEDLAAIIRSQFKMEELF